MNTRPSTPSPAKILQDCGIDSAGLHLLYELHGEAIWAFTTEPDGIESPFDMWGFLANHADETGFWPVIVGRKGRKKPRRNGSSTTGTATCARPTTRL
jgi:hypothetical protein